MNILPAKEFIGQWLIDNTEIKADTPEEAFRQLWFLFDPNPASAYLAKAAQDYTKIHVKKALENANKDARTYEKGTSDGYEHWYVTHIDENSILNAYPESNIQ